LVDTDTCLLADIATIFWGYWIYRWGD
jgi:hypothetical protein